MFHAYKVSGKRKHDKIKGVILPCMMQIQLGVNGVLCDFQRCPLLWLNVCFTVAKGVLYDCYVINA